MKKNHSFMNKEPKQAFGVKKHQVHDAKFKINAWGV